MDSPDFGFSNLPTEDCQLRVQPLDCVSKVQVFLWCRNLPYVDCWPGVKPVYLVSEPTTMSLGCSMFIPFSNLLYGDCWSGMQPVYTVSGPILEFVVYQKLSLF